METSCYCGSQKSFSECCEPKIKGIQKALTAEALMRSRYSAYCIRHADYLMATTHSSTRRGHNKADLLSFATANHWLKLEIITSSETLVEFKAYYLDSSLVPQIHHEVSTFKKEDDAWFYVDGTWY